MSTAKPGLVAIVDDEPHLRETVAFALGRDGYRVQTYADGGEAWEAFNRELPDLVVLDIMMPRMDGLELGGDDYLGKPFSMRELRARIKVLFRRLDQSLSNGSQPEELVTAGELRLDLQRYETRWGDRPVELTVTEFLLLAALARAPGHVKSRRQLMEQSYAHDAYVSDRTIDSHVKRIRSKLTALDPAFAAIETVYGVGYRYRAPEP